MKYILTFLLIPMAVCSAFSQIDRFYNNNAGTSIWSDPGNWLNSNIADGNDDIANIEADVTVDVSYTINRLVVPSNQTTGKTISGNLLTIDVNDLGFDMIGLWNQSATGLTMNITNDIMINNSQWVPGVGSTNIQVANAGNSIVFNNMMTVNNFTKVRSLSGASIDFNGSILGSANFTFAIPCTNVTFGAGANNNAFTGFFAVYCPLLVSNITTPGGFLPSTAGLRVAETGTITINGANTMEGSIWALGATGNFTLDFNADQNNIGTVKISNGTLTLDLEPSGTNLSFANSSAEIWNGTLAINNFQDYIIRFGTDNTGLTSAQLAKIDCGGGGTVLIDNQGYLYKQPACQITASGLSNVQCDDNGTPSDPTDDFITFDLDPQGLGLGTTYTVTGATLTPNSGTYGSSTTFSTNPGTAGAGNLNIIIEDDAAAGCTLSETVTDPGTCSDECLLTSSGLSNIQCDDNGTPSDPSDDFITFELNPMGLNLGINYTIQGATVTPTIGSYGSSTTFSTNAGTAGAGNLNITIQDGSNGGCTFPETITDPGTCSDECLLNSSGLSNIQCDDNGTPSDPTDDFITFELDPDGLNLGFGYTVMGAFVTPSGGNYGSSTTFSTQSGTAGNGNLSITIEDNSNSACTFPETVSDPGTCSDECLLNSSGLSNIQCDDNGTPSDPSDDFITFELDPDGLNLGITYTVTGAVLSPSGGNYGSLTTFSTNPGTAGGGNLNIIIQDDNDGACTFPETVFDPGTCSDECLLNSSGLSNIQCDDNGTPSDPSDDFITFELNPMGLNLGSGYTVTGATVSPGSGSYGSPTVFSTNPGTAGNGNLNITIQDNNDGACTFPETISDPGTCSPQCLITASGLSNIQCQNNGTPSDPSDDYFTFDLNPQGMNLGASYTITGATVSPSGSSYGNSTNFSTSPGTAGNGNLNITIQDNNDGACTFPEMVFDPGTCSGECAILTSGLAFVQCQDNGTPGDPSDDYIIFELNPTGLNLSNSYNIVGIFVSPSSANYGSPAIFSTLPGTAGAGDLNFVIEDNDDSGCVFPETVIDPGTCSDECSVTSSGLSNIQCQNNGTPSDPSDDYITFDLNPMGGNLGSSYNILGINVSPPSGSYGGTTTFSTLPGTAGAGNLSFVIEDNDDSGCVFAETIFDPGTCSDECSITASGLSNIQCNDNGTPGDDTDDFITFELNPTGVNLGFDYNIIGINVSPPSANYGSSVTFSTLPGTGGAGDLSFVIEDGNDSGCVLTETVLDPGTCSNACSILASGLSNIQCNDNGTPSDPTDDFITFELNPTGNNLGTNYSILNINVTPPSGSYGGNTTFSTLPGTAGAGDLNFEIEDTNDPACTFSETIFDPGTCSDECSILTSGLSNIQCNDNGTPTDDTDDFITFELNPTGNNLGTSYNILNINVTPSSGNYGGNTTFSTLPGTAGAGDLNFEIEDGNNAACTLLEVLTDPGNCSNSCEILTSGLTNIQCDDNGTPSDPTDDFITFELNPTSENAGSGYIISGITVMPSGGNYGTSTTFSTQSGTTGNGDLNFEIDDDTNGGCSFSEILTDPGSCSTECEMNASGLTNIQCNDNGTPSDPTDDFITFELNPTGNNLGASYTISGATVSPNGGNYGTSTTFSTNSGTAGTGDFNITITDDSDGNCNFDETVADPGTCSDVCEISASGISNIQCDDNGTPSDFTDDFITFEVNPTGANLGSNYTISGITVSPTGGNYGTSTTFSTQSGTAGNGDLNFEIEDDTNGGCTFSETITDAGTCSGDCQISASGISNIQCDDNGTPSDPSDDFITFELNPNGNNLGSGYTVSGATVSPTGGNYSTSTTFSTESGTAGAGNLNITITDDSDGNCTLNETITDPGTCSGACEFFTSNLSNIQCNDNGTPSDPTDDFITFELNPTGNNLGMSYTISGATVTPNVGNYGTSTTFSTNAGTAGAGDLNITLTDDSDGNCTFDETITDPGTCSDDCEILTSGLTNIQCNDNGTPSDPTDDFITFELNPTGANLGSGYTISIAIVSPNGGNYGTSTTFSTTAGTAGAGNLNITITDDSDGNCMISETITDPGICSDDCEILTSGLTNVTCNDNGTPIDPSDDFITFDLNPTGNNLGTNYTVSGAILTPTNGNYGMPTSFSTQLGTAGAGDLNITITDDLDGNCTISETVQDPGTCSGTCNLTASGLTNIQCDDNGTPSDPSDDFITFDLNPTGNNLGASYTLNGATVTPIGGNYGETTSFSTPLGTAGLGDLNLTIDDNDNNNCSFGFTVTDPGTCSDECLIIASGLANIQCNDNGTPSDPSDDFITFDLNPTGSNLGINYFLSGIPTTPLTGIYGSVTNFSTPFGSAGAGNLLLTITDDSDGNCTFIETIIDPGACSGNCDIATSGLMNIQCNDNGTPSDSSDDFITFELNPTGNNLGSGYTISGATVTPNSANYGTSTTFSTNAGTAGSGDLNITITDNDDGNCSISETVIDPGTCSDDCEILTSGLINIQCDDNGTPADGSDDFITFELNPTGFNLGNTYQISGATVTPNGGNYGSTTIFSTNPGTAGAGDLNITITDDSDGACTFSEIITDPGDCVDCQPFTVNITAPSAICAGETADLTFTTTGGIAPIIAQYFDGLTNNNITIGATGTASVTVTPNGMTTYSVTSILDADGCLGTTGTDATISIFPDAVGAFSDSFCEGETYTLPDGSTVASPDIYEVVLQNQSANGCDSTVTVNLSQNQFFAFNEDVIICDSDVYVWNGQTYSSTGIYTLDLQTINGCDSTLTLNLTFDGIAQFGEADAGTDADECTTETELFGQEVTGTMGIWTSSTGATVEPNDQGAAFATDLQSGQNIFVWTLSTDNCPDFDSDSVTINVLDVIPILEDDAVTFQNSDDIEIQILENDNLNGINPFLVTCFGLPSEITNCEFDANNETLNLQIQSNTTGDFKFFYSICSDDCPDLCDSTTVFLELLGAPTDQINYIITPENQDGLNDVLFIKGLDQFPNNSLIIYNRWGSVVFEAEPYDNTWDGSRNGKRLPEADYYYVLRKEFPDKIEYGNVTIKY